MKNKKGNVALADVWPGFVLVAVLLIALICYLIVFSNIGSSLPKIGNTTNLETGFINGSGYTLAATTNPGFTLTSIIAVNRSSGVLIPAANYSTSNGVVINGTAVLFNNVSFNYSYAYNGADIIATGTARDKFIAVIPMLGMLLLIICLAAVIGVVLVALMFRTSRA